MRCITIHKQFTGLYIISEISFLQLHTNVENVLNYIVLRMFIFNRNNTEIPEENFHLRFVNLNESFTYSPLNILNSLL